MFVRQCKGKDYIKLPHRFIPADAEEVLFSTKRDGHYIQVEVDYRQFFPEIKFYTSGGKEFYVQAWALDLMQMFRGVMPYKFILECEYVGATTGKLGARTQCGKLTTYRTEYSKGVESYPLNGEVLYVFGMVKYSPNGSLLKDEYKIVHNELSSIKDGKYFKIESQRVVPFSEAVHKAELLCARGYEGGYVLLPDGHYQPNKRVNDRIKLKVGGEVTLKCVKTTKGRGKYTGLIGALVLDTAGTVAKATVNVGSGLTDEQRQADPDSYVGKMVTISYFNVHDNYNQPRVKEMR